MIACKSISACIVPRPQIKYNVWNTNEMDDGTRIQVDEEPVAASASAAMPLRWTPATAVSYTAVLLLSGVLMGIGLDWGQPGGLSWYPDGVGGLKTVLMMPNLFEGPWPSKYPKMQFLLNAALYQPMLHRWSESVADGQTQMQIASQMDHASELLMVARWLVLLMGVGTVGWTMLTCRRLFSDNAAGFWAGAAMGSMQLFIYFSHVDGVDVPCLFWYAGCVYFTVLAVQRGRWRDYLLAGGCGALSISTKDPIAGYLAGVAIVAVAGLVMNHRRMGKSWGASLRTLATPRVVGGIGVFLFLYALLNNLLTNPSDYFSRMEFWLKGPGTANYRGEYHGQLPLLWMAMGQWVYSMGWPLAAAGAAGAVYCLGRYRWAGAVCLVPAVAFYGIVIVYTKFSFPRFFLPMYAGLAIAAGKACSDWLTAGRRAKLLRWLVVAGVYGASLLYCIGLDLEMVRDSRYDVEAWCVDHVVDRRAWVAALGPRDEIPRLHMKGFENYIQYWNWQGPLETASIHHGDQWAAYVIVFERAIQSADSLEPRLRKGLFDGSLGYDPVAQFGPRYLYPSRTLFGLPGWPFVQTNKISPKIFILKHRD
jgi:hypothetical protein